MKIKKYTHNDIIKLLCFLNPSFKKEDIVSIHSFILEVLKESLLKNDTDSYNIPNVGGFNIITHRFTLDYKIVEFMFKLLKNEYVKKF